jgi:hypothetical protein
MARRATQATRSTPLPAEALAHPIVGRGVWRPQEGPQHALCDCPCPEVFFGGTRGGGKTDGVLGKWAIKERRYGAAFNAMAFRPTQVSFEDAIQRSKEIYGSLGGEFSKSPVPHWQMPHGGRVSFAYLETIDDADQYQGRNVTDAWVEEGGLYKTSAPIDRLFGVLRSAHGVPIQLVITANPGGAGQLWLRDRYQLVPFPLKSRLLTRRLPDGSSHYVAVIPSRLENNKILLSRDPGYKSRLYLVGSKQLVKAWLEGDWTAIEGAFFDCWSEKQHVIPPFVVPDDWLRFRSGDWGSASPFSFGWWAVVQDDFELPADVDYAAALKRRFDQCETNAISSAIMERVPAARMLPRGSLVRYREDYGASGPGKGLKLSADQVGHRLVKSEKGDKPLAYAVLDPSTFKEDGGPSIAERINKILLDNKPQLAAFRAADNSRVSRVQGRDRGGPMGGWDAVRGRMIGTAKIDDDGLVDWSTGRPMIYTFSTCKDSIRTIPTLQHDPDRAEDLDTNSEDHAADDWRYAVLSRPWLKETMKPEEPADGYKPVEDAARLTEGFKLL